MVFQELVRTLHERPVRGEEVSHRTSMGTLPQGVRRQRRLTLRAASQQQT